MFLFAATVLAAWGIDRLLKYWIASQFVLNQPVPVFPPAFYLTYVQNRGAAFGLFPALSHFYLVVGFVVSAIIILYMLKNYRRVPVPARLALGLVLGGTLSNMGDRLLHGWVIDYLDFRFWPVFNVADAAINMGVLILLITWWRQPNKEATSGRLPADSAKSPPR